VDFRAAVRRADEVFADRAFFRPPLAAAVLRARVELALLRPFATAFAIRRVATLAWRVVRFATRLTVRRKARRGFAVRAAAVEAACVAAAAAVEAAPAAL